MGCVTQDKKEGFLPPVEVDLDKRDVVATFAEKTQAPTRMECDVHFLSSSLTVIPRAAFSAAGR